MKRERHKKWISGLPCLICGDNTSTEVAHVRHGDRTVAKDSTGMGIKPDDAFTVPLCSKHHREQHSRGEAHWWRTKGIDAVKVALGLHYWSGNQERGEFIIRNARIVEITGTL